MTLLIILVLIISHDKSSLNFPLIQSPLLSFLFQLVWWLLASFFFLVKMLCQMFIFWNWSLLNVFGCHQRYSNLKRFLVTEIGFQVPVNSILHSLHMLIHWSICGNQGAEDQTIDHGRTWRSLEKDISHVVCVLHQHSAGECELTFHSSFIYANNKVIYSCNHRSGLKSLMFTSYFLYFLIFSIF